MNSNAFPAQPGWTLVVDVTGGTYPVVAWLPVDRVDGGRRVQQLWPVALRGGLVPEAVGPEEMQRAGLHLEKPKEDGS